MSELNEVIARNNGYLEVLRDINEQICSIESALFGVVLPNDKPLEASSTTPTAFFPQVRGQHADMEQLLHEVGKRLKNLHVLLYGNNEISSSLGSSKRPQAASPFPPVPTSALYVEADRKLTDKLSRDLEGALRG